MSILHRKQTDSEVAHKSFFGGVAKYCNDLRTSFTAHRWKYYIGSFWALLCVVVLVLPSPYVIESAGPTQNVLSEVNNKPVISITGAKTYHDSGKLLLVTVNALGVPGYPATNAQALFGWADPHQSVIPSEAVFPIGQNAGDYEKESTNEMNESQDSATKAALSYAKTHGIDTSGIKVTLHIDDIGGPSAGTMYALGILDMITPVNEAGNHVIAGTGTMSADQKVGAIGGIRLKMLGAKRDGATWFLAPAANCDEVVGHIPSGLRDVKVSNLDEAYRAIVSIGRGNGESLPRCTVQ